MEEKTANSTVAFKSNLQIVNGYIDKDSVFLSSIHDPFALTIMRERNYSGITSQQKEEFSAASLHCTYAPEDDYPWGTIINENGEPKVVCKCTNVSCSYFNSCRPDFEESELKDAKENYLYETEVIAFDDNDDNIEPSNTKLNHGDEEATTRLLNNEREEDNSTSEELDTVNDSNSENVSKVYEEDSNEEPSKKLTVDENVVSFDSFIDVEQQDIIEKDPIERTIINAGPGTGKTWTLIEKIKYMLTVEDVDPENILVICFSRAAVEVIRNRLADAADNDELPLKWHEIDVRTFDSFATFLLAWAQEYKPELLSERFSLECANYDQRITAAVKVIREFDELLIEYRHIIIDEVQDLVGIRAEMVLALLNNLPTSCGFTILGDACQALYDYLAVDAPEIIDSHQFYNNIFAKFNYANYCSLTQNYRQGDAFCSLLTPYRDAILHGDDSSRRAEAININEMISMSDINLKKLSRNIFSKYQKLGTVGIITRTNGQALQISSWLHTDGIEHNLQKAADSREFAAWIAKILMNTDSLVLDRYEFEELFGEMYPTKKELTDIYWNALVSTQKDQTKNHFEIDDLLRGLLNNARDPLLFEEPVNGESLITVSNIHRAKGREFDIVFVIDDVLNALTNDECDDILEHKVCYVALTRPKKGIEKVHLDSQYIYISKDEKRRCFKAGGRFNRKYLSHIEIGDTTDFNQCSFAMSGNNQQYIQKMPPDTRLKLLKCLEKSDQYVIYKIVPEDDSNIVLGYTTPSFSLSIKKAIQRIFEKPGNIQFKYYPNIFTDVYFNGLTTCVSGTEKDVPGAKMIGDMNVWFGLSISGFAQMEKDRY